MRFTPGSNINWFIYFLKNQNGHCEEELGRSGVGSMGTSRCVHKFRGETVDPGKGGGRGTEEMMRAGDILVIV